jgi:transcriptional regulator with XRE-family HTH domain
MAATTAPTVSVNGSAVREIRVAAGLNAVIVARKAGISAAYLSQIENGVRSRMSPAKFNALTKALGVDRAALLAEDAA